MLRAWLVLAVLCAGTARAAGPSYTAAGIVNASSYASGPFAPNSILSVFGTGLARSPQAAPAGATVPTELNYVRVYVQDQLVPLLFVSETQVNFIMSSVQKPGPVRVRVVTEGLSGPEVTVTLVDSAPSLFPNLNADGYALATSADNRLLTPDAPAHPGDIIVIWITGLGRTSPNPNPGEVPNYAAQVVAPASLKVTLGSMSIDPSLVKYAGLTPGWAGLYQINLYIPEGVGTDPELRVAGDVTASGLKLAIR